jgi:hypothetical protein
MPDSNKTCIESTATSLLLRIGIAAMLIIGSVSCAVTEPAPSPVPVTTAGNNDAAWNAFSQRQFALAVEEFERVTSNPQNSTDVRRQAWLGKALVYLSTDPEWRDLAQARNAVQSADDIVNGSQTDSASKLFSAAIDGHINAESDNTELNGRIKELLRELEKIKTSTAALQSENDALLAEQEKLNAALEKMKELTLGN